jgi:hypothetical protein
MSVTGQPSGIFHTDFVFDALIANGPVKTASVTLERKVGAVSTDFVRGRLLQVDVDGKGHILSSTETTVALNATGEVIKNNLLAASGVAPIPFTLAHPPIPGTVHLATTADGSATILKELGTDNGHGAGSGAGGNFTIDYATGQGVAYLATAATDTNDLKAGYTYRGVDPADAGESLSGLPTHILAEDVAAAVIDAADVVVTAYVAGEFLATGLVGYSAGYKPHLRTLGIFVR